MGPLDINADVFANSQEASTHASSAGSLEYAYLVLLSGKKAVVADWVHLNSLLPNTVSVVVTADPDQYKYLAQFYIEKRVDWTDTLIKFLTGAPRP